MIDNILKMLSIDEFKGQSELIDIAKGKYKIPNGFKEGVKQVKRELAWKRRK